MEWAWLIPVFSFAAAPLIVVFGRVMPGRGSVLAILAITAGFGLFWWVFAGFLGAGAGTENCEISHYTETLTCHYEMAWFNAGLAGEASSVLLTWGFIVDPLTVAMLGLVTFVALMVQIYSLGYMKCDARFGWYYAVHAMFAAAMLTLVLADNFLLLYVAWELVGICSYLLIGFWHERPAAKEAAKKAFIVTRIGDVGMLIGILLIYREVGSFSMFDAFEAVSSGAMTQGVTTIAALLLFLGAMGKSAQFPFHVWLPDAMEGPTPVSALIHAATMVVAGVFLVARVYPIFSAYDGDALFVVAVVGLITALMASTIALVSVDLKRILAYSTISHLGLMMLALGAAGYTAAIFHLLAHGFAKALLFLGAGSVMHGTDELDIRKMGGLRKAMPMTAFLFSLGALSLGGIPILSGFWSKDEILLAVNDHLNKSFIVLALFTAFLSAMYMARAMFVPFFGKMGEDMDHAHESPMAMIVPMALLGIFAVFFGFAAFNWPGSYDGIGSFIFFHEAEGFHFNWWLGITSIILAVGAFVLGYLIYLKGSVSLEGFHSKMGSLVRVAEGKYYFDEVYQWMVDHVVMILANFIGLFDRVVVNDLAVNGPANTVRRLGIVMRLHVTGHVYSYALGMVVGTVALSLFWWFRAVS